MQDTLTQHYNHHQFDRMGLTMFFALALHAIVILGISFDVTRAYTAEVLASAKMYEALYAAPQEEDGSAGLAE